MSITLHDIAREVGVSIATVSRVLSKSDYPVNAATRQKVLDVAVQLGYSPNLMARNLRTEQSYTIRVITDDCWAVMDLKLLIWTGCIGRRSVN